MTTTTWLEGDPLSPTNFNTKGVGAVAPTTLNVQTASNIGTSNPLSYTLPGGTLAADGQGIRIRARLTNTQIANFSLIFGGTTVFTAGMSSSSDVMAVDCIVRRTGAATQTIHATVFTQKANYNLFRATASETLSGDVVIKLQATSAGFGTNVEDWQVDLLPVANVTSIGTWGEGDELTPTNLNSKGLPRTLLTTSLLGVTSTNLISYTLPAGILSTDGQAVRIGIRAIAHGSTRLVLTFGATQVVSFLSSNGDFLDVDCVVRRTGASTQVSHALALSQLAIYQFTRLTPGETLSGPVTITVATNSSTTIDVEHLQVDLITA